MLDETMKRSMQVAEGKLIYTRKIELVSNYFEKKPKERRRPLGIGEL